MRKFLLFSALVWCAGAGYVFLGPGKQQLQTLRSQAAMEMGVWRPEKASRSSGCSTDGLLPDPACTPGALRTADRTSLCLPRDLSSPARGAVSREEWSEVMRAYGVKRLRGVSINRLIPLSLGGSDQQANLWPIKNKFISNKRKVERRLLRRVCAGSISLARAQQGLSENWTQAG